MPNLSIRESSPKQLLNFLKRDHLPNNNGYSRSQHDAERDLPDWIKRAHFARFIQGEVFILVDVFKNQEPDQEPVDFDFPLLKVDDHADGGNKGNKKGKSG